MDVRGASPRSFTPKIARKHVAICEQETEISVSRLNSYYLIIIPTHKKKRLDLCA